MIYLRESNTSARLLVMSSEYEFLTCSRQISLFGETISGIPDYNLTILVGTSKDMSFHDGKLYLGYF